MTVGQSLREARMKAGYTLAKLQKEHGFDAGYISNVESGKKKISSLQYFGKLMKIYNISFKEFYDKIFIPIMMEGDMTRKKKKPKPKPKHTYTNP